MPTCKFCNYTSPDDANRFCGQCGRAFAEEESSVFGVTVDLYLLQVDPARKIEAIKLVREITGMGLKEAKDTVEHCPQLLNKNITREDATAKQSQFTAIGAQTQINSSDDTSIAVVSINDINKHTINTQATVKVGCLLPAVVIVLLLIMGMLAGL